MCAINPAHKKRFILDVYTSDTRMTAEKFSELVRSRALHTEILLNESGLLRWHIKETEQEAE